MEYILAFIVGVFTGKALLYIKLTVLMENGRLFLLKKDGTWSPSDPRR